MIGSSTFIQALAASLADQSIDACLTLLKKTISAVEQRQIKSTDRLSRALVKVINSVKKEFALTPEQLALLSEYRTRIGAFDPRINPREPAPAQFGPRSRGSDDEAYQEPIKPNAPVPDGFEPDFLDIDSAIDRVTAKYDVRPRYSDLENDRLLQTFLGDDIPLDSHSANQLWQALARAYKSRGGNLAKPFRSLFSPQVQWAQTALCSYVNRNEVSAPVPNCLSISEDLGFRS